MFILFFTSILAALGTEWLLTCRRGHGRLVALAMTALLIDTGSTAVQPVARLDKAFLIEAGKAIAASRPQQRVVEAGLGPNGGIHVSIGPNASPMSFYANVQRVAGTHNMAATLVHNYAISIAKLAQNDLTAQQSLTSETERLLRMLNVGRIVCSSSFRMGCPQRLDPVTDGVLGGVVPVADASPVLFAQRLVHLAPAPNLDKPMLWDEQFRASAHDSQVAEIRSFLAKWLQVTGSVHGGRRHRPRRPPSPGNDRDAGWRTGHGPLAPAPGLLSRRSATSAPTGCDQGTGLRAIGLPLVSGDVDTGEWTRGHPHCKERQTLW